MAVVAVVVVLTVGVVTKGCGDGCLFRFSSKSCGTHEVSQVFVDVCFQTN